MSSQLSEPQPKSTNAGAWRPALTLAVLSPLIAEVLSGATKFSVLFALIPEILTWGCGALAIRELVRRWRGGWTSMLLLGLGISVGEEFIIQQTSLAPLPFPGALAHYGRACGVNWIYFLFMLGYESVWVVLVPVQITELIFSARGRQPWLRTRGLIISAILFLLGSRIAWYAWIKRARPIVFHLPPYNPGALTIGAGLLAIALLAFLAYLARRVGTAAPSPSRNAPPAWLMIAIAFALGCPWYILMSFVFRRQPPPIAFQVVLICGILWALLVYWLLGHWIHAARWSGLHAWATAFGATLLCMAAGFLGSNAWSHLDFYGKIVLNVAAVLAFFALLANVRRSTSPGPEVHAS